jgi:hypothetical protein
MQFSDFTIRCQQRAEALSLRPVRTAVTVNVHTRWKINRILALTWGQEPATDSEFAQLEQLRPALRRRVQDDPNFLAGVIVGRRLPAAPQPNAPFDAEAVIA